MSTIGFIGLGIMGNPMSGNLLKGGHSLVVYDVVPELVERLVERGAAQGASSADVAARSEIVITMLPDGPTEASTSTCMRPRWRRAWRRTRPISTSTMKS